MWDSVRNNFVFDNFIALVLEVPDFWKVRNFRHWYSSFEGLQGSETLEV